MSLIILGTASHVGKTITVAAVCRCLINRNITIAPFKSQNMSLNSYVTEDGAEIGIAQAMQAFAAGIPPSADMNPVLLKPKGDRTSQVVLLGKPYKDVHIGEYYLETEMLLEMAVKAYKRLEDKYSNVIIEGAGGAAELNLYEVFLHSYMVQSLCCLMISGKMSKVLSSTNSGVTLLFLKMVSVRLRKLQAFPYWVWYLILTSRSRVKILCQLLTKPVQEEMSELQ